MNLRARFTPGSRKPPRPDPVDSCGCAMGARFLAVAFAGSTAWYLSQWHAYSFGGICGRVLLVSFAAAVLGKIVGIVWFRLKHSRPSPLAAAKPPSSLGQAVDKRALANPGGRG